MNECADAHNTFPRRGAITQTHDQMMRSILSIFNPSEIPHANPLAHDPNAAYDRIKLGTNAPRQIALPPNPGLFVGADKRNYDSVSRR
jgi:hypothetical protein